MDAKSILLAIFTACLGIVGKIVFDWLSGKKHVSGNGHTTGEKRPEYWLEHLNDIKNMLRDYNAKLESNRDTLNRIETELTRLRGRGR
jgi:hypothetical protein